MTSQFTHPPYPPSAASTSTPWIPLSSFYHGIAITSFTPRFNNIKGGIGYALNEEEEEEGNPFQQRLSLGDEVYAFEECFSRDGERWYRGYVVLQPSTRDIPLNVFNIPIPFTCSSSSSSSISLPITPGSSKDKKPNLLPLPEPIVFLGIFPAKCVHIRGKVEAYRPPVSLGSSGSKKVGEANGEMKTVEEGDEEEEIAKNGLSSPKTPTQTFTDVNNDKSTQDTPTQRKGKEKEKENDNDIKTAHRRTASRISLSAEMLGAMKYLEQTHPSSSSRSNGTSLESNSNTVPNPDLHSGSEPIAGPSKSPAPIPSLRADYTSLSGRSDPIIDHISSAIRDWLPHLPSLLRHGEYTKFTRLEKLSTYLLDARKKFLRGDMTTYESKELRRMCGRRLKEGNSILGLEVVLREEEGGRMLVTDFGMDGQGKGKERSSGKDTDKVKWIAPMELLRMEEEGWKERQSSVEDGSMNGKSLNGLPIKNNSNSISASTSTITSPLSKKFSVSASTTKRNKSAETPSLRVEFKALTAPSLCHHDQYLELFFSIYDRDVKAFITEEWYLRLDHLGMVVPQTGMSAEQDPISPIDSAGFSASLGNSTSSTMGAGGMKLRRTIFEAIGSNKNSSYLVVKIIKVGLSKDKDRKERVAMALGVCGLGNLPMPATTSKVLEQDSKLLGDTIAIGESGAAGRLGGGAMSERKLDLWMCGGDSGKLVDFHERIIARSMGGETSVEGAVVLSLQIESHHSDQRRLRSTTLTRSFDVSDDRDELYVRFTSVHLPDFTGVELNNGLLTDNLGRFQCQLSLQAADGTAIPHSIRSGGNARGRHTVVDAVMTGSARGTYLGDLFKVINLEPNASLVCKVGWHGRAVTKALIPLTDGISYLSEGVHRFNFGDANGSWVEARIHLCSSSRIQNKVLAALTQIDTIPAEERPEILRLVSFVEGNIVARHRKACILSLLRIVSGKEYEDAERKAAFNAVLVLVNQFDDLPTILRGEKIPASQVLRSLGDALDTDKRMDAIKAFPRLFELYASGGLAATTDDFPQLFIRWMTRLVGVIREGDDSLLAFRLTALVVFPNKLVSDTFSDVEAAACLSDFLDAFSNKDHSPLIQEARLSLLERAYQESPLLAVQLLTETVRIVRSALNISGSSQMTVQRKVMDVLAVAVDAAITVNNLGALEYLSESLLRGLLQWRQIVTATSSETDFLDSLIAMFARFVSTEWLSGTTTEPSTTGLILDWASSVDIVGINSCPWLTLLMVETIVHLCSLADLEQGKWDAGVQRLVLSVLGSRLFRAEPASIQMMSTCILEPKLAEKLQTVMIGLGRRANVSGRPPSNAQFRALLDAQQPYQALAMTIIGPHLLNASDQVEDCLMSEVLDMLVYSSRERGVSKLSTFVQSARSVGGFEALAQRATQLQKAIAFDTLVPAAAWHDVLALLRSRNLPTSLAICSRLIRQQNTDYPINGLLADIALAQLDGRADTHAAEALGKAAKLSEYNLANKLCAAQVVRAQETGETLQAARMLRQQSELMLQSINKLPPPVQYWRTTMEHYASDDLNASEGFDLVWSTRQQDGLGRLMTALIQAYPGAEIRPAKGIDAASSAEIVIYLEELTVDPRPSPDIEHSEFYSSPIATSEGLERTKIRTKTPLPGILPHAPVSEVTTEWVLNEDLAERLFVQTVVKLKSAIWKAELGLEQAQPNVKQQILTTYSQTLDSVIDDEDLVNIIQPYLGSKDNNRTDPAAASANVLLDNVQHALKLHGSWTAQSDLRSFHFTLVQLFTINFKRPFNQSSVDLSNGGPGSPASLRVSPVGQASPARMSPGSPQERTSSPSPSTARPRSSLSIALSDKLPSLRSRFGSIRSQRRGSVKDND